jgi:hypothetical protein
LAWRSCTSRSVDRSLLLFDRRRRERGVEPPAAQDAHVATVCIHKDPCPYVPDRGANGGIERTTADKSRSGADQATQGQGARDKPVPKLMFYRPARQLIQGRREVRPIWCLDQLQATASCQRRPPNLVLSQDRLSRSCAVESALRCRCAIGSADLWNLRSCEAGAVAGAKPRRSPDAPGILRQERVLGRLPMATVPA